MTVTRIAGGAESERQSRRRRTLRRHASRRHSVGGVERRHCDDPHRGRHEVTRNAPDTVIASNADGSGSASDSEEGGARKEACCGEGSGCCCPRARGGGGGRTGRGLTKVNQKRRRGFRNQDDSYYTASYWDHQASLPPEGATHASELHRLCCARTRAALALMTHTHAHTRTRTHTHTHNLCHTHWRSGHWVAARRRHSKPRSDRLRVVYIRVQRELSAAGNVSPFQSQPGRGPPLPFPRD